MGYRALASRNTMLTKYTGCSTRLGALVLGALRRPWRLLRRWGLRKLVSWGKGLFRSQCAPLRRLILLSRGGDLRDSFLVLLCLDTGSSRGFGPMLLPNCHQSRAGGVRSGGEIEYQGLLRAWGHHHRRAG